jgi:hypothetical protein
MMALTPSTVQNMPEHFIREAADEFAVFENLVLGFPRSLRG